MCQACGGSSEILGWISWDPPSRGSDTDADPLVGRTLPDEVLAPLLWADSESAMVSDEELPAELDEAVLFPAMASSVVVLTPTWVGSMPLKNKLTVKITSNY